jgi:hypothetical protein
MLDPVARAIANAPIDDEPVSEKERQAVARSEAWLEERGGKGIPMEEVLADFGLTIEDLASACENSPSTSPWTSRRPCAIVGR